MSGRLVILGVAIGAVMLASSPSAGPAPTATQAWTQPLTSWGDPDLQGIWTNFFVSSFDIEAPGSQPRVLSGTGVGSPCKPAGAASRASGSVGAGPPNWNETEPGDPGASGRGLLVEPSDGRLPPITLWAEQKLDNVCEHAFDSYEYLTPWVRCISRGVPGTMFPSAYNNAYHILQTPGYVTILSEMIHDARIIPLDGGPRVGQQIRLWMGESHGHWEGGNTLVVETTQFPR